MANLFGKNQLREAASKIDTESILGFVEIVKRWHADYHSGSLKTDKETSREQEYNHAFFKTILGYEEKPANPYSFEPKATTDKGQLPDAVIGYTDTAEGIRNIAAVIELKGAGIDLDRPQRREGNFSPVQQGFKYKAQYRSVPFVIVSNFWEFRLYHDNMLDYEVWTLDDLVNPADDYLLFKTWYVLHHKDNFVTKSGQSKTEMLISDIRIEQENIGKKFYKVYKQARLELLRDIYQNNSSVRTDIDFGIQKAQKIIDRIVFAAFAEDRGLLPDNTLHRVLSAADHSVVGASLWNVLKGFFEAIDKGSEKLDIPNGYNGGLFKFDPELNVLQISDEPLRKVVELASYNFAEDLSVQILGHIFEQSISDLEEIKSKVNESQNLDAISQSRRKKDGIFYTPDYIVRYIVDNSLGAYLREAEEKFKAEFKLKDDILDKTYEKRERQAYLKYYEFLKNVKVVDPACGSGAFLVYVFDYLLAEYQRVGAILGLDKGVVSFDQVHKNILNRNIYGVDLNAESVEITKLSLWLKTAQKGKQLTALDENIKCGNSLIDDPEIARDKAFNWQEQFAEIFDNGGFDVVVGNPPYVDSEVMTRSAPEERAWLAKSYKTTRGNWDLFIPFIEKSIGILKSGGYTSMIIPNKILSAPYAKALRKHIDSKYKLVGLADVTKEGVFDVDVYPVITNVKKCKTSDLLTVAEGVKNPISKTSVANNNLPENWALLFNSDMRVVHKVETVKLGSLFNTASAATVSEAYGLKEIIHEYENAKNGKVINTGTIDPYITGWGVSLMSYIKDRYKCPYVDISLLKAKEWHKLNKIIVAGMAVRIEAAYSKGDEYLPAKSTVVVYGKDDNEKSLKSLLAVLNSRYISYLFKQENSQLSMAGGYMNVNANNLADIQILPQILDNEFLSTSADNMLALTAMLQSKDNYFRQLIVSEFDTVRWPKKLNKWWTLDFAGFVRVLKVKLTLEQKDELLPIFEKYRTELAELDAKIQTTEREIDQLVYQLYELSDEEVAIVEGLK